MTAGAVSADDRGDRIRLEGAFVLEGTGRYHALDTAVPLDAANDHFALFHEVADIDVTMRGQFPTAVRYTTGHGEAVRTGSRSFDYTIHAWAVDASNRRVSIIVSSGAKQFPEGDANTYRTVGGTMAVYRVEQDGDGDGMPDPGENPIVCLPFECTARRMRIVPPCTP